MHKLLLASSCWLLLVKIASLVTAFGSLADADRLNDSRDPRARAQRPPIPATSPSQAELLKALAMLTDAVEVRIQAQSQPYSGKQQGSSSADGSLDPDPSTRRAPSSAGLLSNIFGSSSGAMGTFPMLNGIFGGQQNSSFLGAPLLGGQVGPIRAGALDASLWAPGASGQIDGETLRIVGGSKVEDKDRYPYISSLRDPGSGEHFCGASLIASRAVVTAAHCLDRDTFLRRLPGVDVGRHKLRGDDNGIWFRRSCQTVYVHPDWNNDIGVGDIALCILDEDVDVEPVEVAPDDLEVPTDESIPLTVVGWGAVQEGGRNVEDLRDLRSCRRVYGTIESSQMCAGLPGGGADACQGDSGGPLLLHDEPSSSNKGDVLVGLVSFGSGCGQPGKPGVYTRMASYRGWISQKLQETCARPSFIFCGTFLQPLPPSSMDKPYFDPDGPPSAPISAPSPSQGFGIWGPGFLSQLFWQALASIFFNRQPQRETRPRFPPSSRETSQAEDTRGNTTLLTSLIQAALDGSEDNEEELFKGSEGAAPCKCTQDGSSGGIFVEGRGCGAHTGTGSSSSSSSSSISSMHKYCYVRGGTSCKSAIASAVYPGAAWRECDLKEKQEDLRAEEVKDISNTAVRFAVQNAIFGN